MASIRKRNGRYQAQVRINGHSSSSSFDTRSEARAWAAGIEASLLSSCRSRCGHRPHDMAEIMHHYMAKISPAKRTHKNEIIMLDAMLRESWMSIPLKELKPSHLAEYRDRRLQTIKPASFNRQFCIIVHACRIAKDEWGWIFDGGFLNIRKAKTPPPSAIRRVNKDQLALLLDASRGCRNKRMEHIIELAIETGLRRSELCSLIKSDVDLNNGMIKLVSTKNGFPRTIPLTGRATQAVKALMTASGTEHLVDITPNAIRLGFVRVRTRAGLGHIKFHDLRHEAVSRFFEMGLSPPEVASISGHRTLSQLMRYSHAMEERVACVVRAM